LNTRSIIMINVKIKSQLDMVGRRTTTAMVSPGKGLILEATWPDSRWCDPHWPDWTNCDNPKCI